MHSTNEQNEFNRIRKQVDEQFQPEIDKALRQLRAHADVVIKGGHSASVQLGQMRDRADELNLRNYPDETLTEYLGAASREAQSSSVEDNVVRGGQKFRCRKTPEILPGFMKEGFLHVLNAEQGTGKSCFVLGLFKALRQEQTGKFLDLEVLSSKNWELFLIARDMPRESWFEPLTNYGLLSNVLELSNDDEEGDLTEGVTIACSDVPYTLSPDHIQEFRQMALDSVAKGNKPLFVFDSYRSLTSFSDAEERNSKFADPLQDLYNAMGGTGATTIVLHHTAKGQSQSTASSGSGTNRMGSIPDIVMELERMGRNSDRMVLHSSKRITPTNLIVLHHYEQGHWESKGCANAWMEEKRLSLEIAKLSAVKTIIFEHFQTIWQDQKRGLSKQDIARFREISKVAAGNHVNYLSTQNLVFPWGHEETVGTPHQIFYPFEAREELLNRSMDRLNRVNPGETSNKQGKSPFTKDLLGSDSNGPGAKESLVNTDRQDPAKNDPYETPSKPLSTLRNLTNIYGENVPSVQQMVEDANGQNSMVVVELVPGSSEVRVQPFGNASGPIKTRRWMCDVFPCGTFAKNNPLYLDPDEEI